MLFVFRFTTVIVPLKLFSSNYLTIMDKASPSGASWAVGCFVCDSAFFINFTFKIEKAFILLLANVRHHKAELCIESFAYFVGLNDVIEMGQLSDFTQDSPVL